MKTNTLLRAAFAVLVASAAAAIASSARAETFGNFTTMGVIADCPKGKTPADISRVRAFLVDNAGRRPVQDLVQVGAEGYYATSLFYLRPATEYRIEVEFYGQDDNLLAKTAETGRTRSEPVMPVTKASLYVSPGGDDGNPGTIDKPLRTLAAGFGGLAPGMTLFIREGTYYEGDLAPASGGTPDAPVVVRNYGGERTVIDGADDALLTDGWTSESPGIYMHAFAGSTWNVTAEDKATGKYYRLYPLRTMRELADRKSDGKTFDELGFTGAYHCDGERIHVVLPKGEIGDYRVHVARYTTGIVLTGLKHVFVDGIQFYHFGNGECGCAVMLHDSCENVIQNCKVNYCNSGVWVKGDSSNNTIQNSLFVDDTNHWNFSYVKNRQGWSYHGQIETGGVVVDGLYSGRGLVFRNNRVEGVFDGSHLCPWTEIKARTSETDWCNNTILNVADDFVETDGVSRNVRIFDNVMDVSLSGVSLAQALDGPTWVVYNVIANCGVCVASDGRADYAYEGYPVKTNGGPDPDIGSGPVFFYHNTAYTSDPRSRAFLVKSEAKWRKFVLRNNIWCGKAMGVDSWQQSLSPMDWDYDDVYNAAGLFMRYRDRGEFKTLADFQKAFNSLVHGISTDPEFANAGAGDYRLADGSPCIDAGVVIDGINESRTKGEAPDLGAFEAR